MVAPTTKQTGVKMRMLILLMAVLLPGVAMAQETVERRDDGFILVKDGNGEGLRWVYSPTPQMALEAIREGKGATKGSMVLKQTVERRSAAELDAFVDELARLVLESPSKTVASAALSVLTGSSVSYSAEEIPYTRELEVLIDIYEATDGTEAIDTWTIWYAIFSAGGENYLKDLFAFLEPPEKACWLPPSRKLKNAPPDPPQEEWCPYRGIPWCELGTFLALEKVEDVDPAHVFSTCNKYMRKGKGGWAPVYH